MSKVILGYALQEGEIHISEADAKKYTHLNIAFGKLQLDQTISTEGLTLLDEIKTLKGYNPNLKISLSIGGGHKDAFSDGAKTEATRKKIASECARIVEEYKLDGIDYDWEFPTSPCNSIKCDEADRENFTLLMKEIRTALDAIDGTHYLLTIAAGGDQYYVDFTNMAEVQQYLDYVFLMTYDLRCGFHGLTGHHTNLYTTNGDIFRTSCDAAVRIFHNAGVPMEKLCIGAAFYSREWYGVKNVNKGLLQLTDGSGPVGYYGPDYTELVNNYINKNGFVRYYDEQAQAPYLFNGSRFISYDDVQSVAAKCDYVSKTGCAGIFHWQHSYDLTGELLDTMAKILK
ncbi:glycoside hydrolase family 18 protein [Paludicola sp. MB14-C6]|uniref:glycoside hydrolase family 18 protein n=1 Tax=Paludihabitans sp. MB14-C6 TaxID=3070656 RepID=UPI0027DC4B4A|nr:glycoside hydrolase family 18 protein [Paludicola sp. MB14-C6]WMJ24068.1 glycoside hydrolase family 18 protein [Paludicola sp. MB14-C6]